MLLAHPLVQPMKQDPVMGPFFSDLEQNGMFGAMAYMSNKAVMSRLYDVGLKIEAEGAAA